MANTTLTTAVWQIDYDDSSVEPIASGMAAGLSKSTAASQLIAKYEPPQDGTYGTPEVILTIVATAAAKAIIVSGLHALESYLQTQSGAPQDRRVRVILKTPNKRAKHSAISLQQLGTDAIKEFVSDIIAAVEKL
jgi:hypothetical protein